MKSKICKLSSMLIITLAHLLICSSSFAQAPQGISHQAVIRDASNNLVSNAIIGIRVSILKGSPDGISAYVETNTPLSNANGLISFVIGQGIPVNGAFAEIDWANGPCFIKTEADPNGGTSYTISGTTQLMSVPYALQASSLVLTSENGFQYEIKVNDFGALTAVALPGQPCPESPTVTDYDGNVYNTVKIGSQCWMKENLKTTHYNSGTAIEYPGTNDVTWFYNTTGAYAWYNNSISWKDDYGALYNWYAVNNENRLCPEGWHVPAYAELFPLLTEYLGGIFAAGGKMKSTRTDPDSHPRWNSPNTGATNESRFSGLPGGFRGEYPGFASMGTYGWWWSSTEQDASWAYGYVLVSNNATASPSQLDKNYGCSVRCLRD